MVRERQAGNRATVLNLELTDIEASLPVEMLTDERFLHAYDATLRATLRSRRDEKIRLFGRLLRSAATAVEITDIDEFEELLGVLDELSYREIQMLVIFARLHAEQQGSNTFWNDLSDEVSRATGIVQDDLLTALYRVSRTGLFEIQMRGLHNRPSGGQLTARYYRLRDLISDCDGNVITLDPVTDPVPPTTTTAAH